MVDRIRWDTVSYLLFQSNNEKKSHENEKKSHATKG